MPTAKNYAGHKELPLSAEEQFEFASELAGLKRTILSYGFSQKAVDDLNFSLKKYTLDISADEARGGAFHNYADGKPFYELTIAAPGTFRDMVKMPQGVRPTEMEDLYQSQMLHFEISMNLVNRVGKALNYLRGLPENVASSGGSGSMARLEFDTTFRCEPEEYLFALDALVKMRLDMIAPKAAVPSAPANKGNNGPRL